MRVLVTGAGGMLARAVRVEFARRNHEVLGLGRSELDVTHEDAVLAALERARPDVVIQCAAYTRVDDAETEEAEATRVNAAGAANVARACARVGARMIYPSTDYVFDGTASEPYPPGAETRPLNAYGRSKLAGERATAKECPTSLVVRTSWLYGAGGRNFVHTILARAREGAELRVVDDQLGSPTWTGDLAGVLAELLERGAAPGVYHATGAGATTWFGFALEAVRLAGLHVPVNPVPSSAFPRPALRPTYSVLDCTATEALVGPIRPWPDALALALREGVDPVAPL